MKHTFTARLEGGAVEVPLDVKAVFGEARAPVKMTFEGARRLGGDELHAPARVGERGGRRQEAGDAGAPGHAGDRGARGEGAGEGAGRAAREGEA